MLLQSLKNIDILLANMKIGINDSTIHVKQHMVYTHQITVSIFMKHQKEAKNTQDSSNNTVVKICKVI